MFYFLFILLYIHFFFLNSPLHCGSPKMHLTAFSSSISESGIFLFIFSSLFFFFHYISRFALNLEWNALPNKFHTLLVQKYKNQMKLFNISNKDIIVFFFSFKELSFLVTLRSIILHFSNLNAHYKYKFLEFKLLTHETC